MTDRGFTRREDVILLRLCSPGARIERNVFGGQRLLVPSLEGFRAYPIVPDEVWSRSVYSSLLADAGLRCAPRLVTLAHAGGSVGFTYDGVIAVGLQDLGDLIAEAFATGHFHRLDPRAAAALRRTNPHAVWSDLDVVRGVLLTILAHELHHQWRRQHGHPHEGVDEEAECDHRAGILGEHHGVPEAIGVAVMALIGCEHAFCSHPPASRRIAAYREGRAAQVRHRRQLEWEQRWARLAAG